MEKTERNEALKALEEKIGYKFQNRYLLECALTHTSYANEQKVHTYEDYERLEFLGDAVLEMVSSAFLYLTYPDKREGEMTKIRASLVCEPALAFCAKDLQLADYIRLGRGEELSGGRQKESIISDVMEAVIGAIYLDSGDVEQSRRFIMRFILSDLSNKRLFYDAKSILQERMQSAGKSLHYEVLSESGPEHAKMFEAGVFIDGKLVASAKGKSKKHAEQHAAYAVLSREK